MKRSFPARLTRRIGISTATLFIAVMAMLAFFSHKFLVEEAHNSMENLLNATTSELEKKLQSVETSVSGTVWLVREHLEDREYLHHITTGVIEDNAIIDGSAVAFSPFYYGKEEYYSPFSYKDQKTGEVINLMLEENGKDNFEKEWYKVTAETGESHWCEPYDDEGGSGNVITTFSYPISDETGSLIAVFTADVPIGWISRMADNIKPYPNSKLTIVSTGGAYITLDKDGGLLKETILTDPRYSSSQAFRQLADSMLDGEKGMVKYRNKDGKRAFAVYYPLYNGWSAALECSYSDVLKRVSSLLSMVMILGLLGLALLFAAIYHTVKHLTKPLSKFSESAMSIAEGNFNTKLPEIRSGDEIQQLSESFDYMQSSLLEYMEDLKATTAANERIESELNIASNIQKAMLPKDFPKTDGIDLYAMMKPAKEVGGDLYDFHIVGNIAYFAVGDVSGKGVPAALFMAITRMALHFTSTYNLDLGLRMSKINSILSADNSTNMFATVLTCALNLETGELTYCNAGHNRAVILHPDGRAEFLDQKPNLAVGVWPGFEYAMQKAMIEKGSKILLYTDGVTEAERADKSQYGDDRLLDWARNSLTAKGQTAEQACTALYDDLHRFTEGNEQNDDITIMTIII